MDFARLAGVIITALLIIMAVPACAQTAIQETPREILDEAWEARMMDEPAMTVLEVRAEDLSELRSMGMEKYVSLKTVVITFTEDPHAPFWEKQIVIDMVFENLGYLEELQKCPALQNIVLQVGEMLFIHGDEKFSEEEADRENLIRTGEKFAGKIMDLLPQVTVYAHNWGW